jgi:hypothetical protein
MQYLWRLVPQVLCQRLAYYNMQWYVGSPQKHEIWRHAMVGDFSPYVWSPMSWHHEETCLGSNDISDLMMSHTWVCIVPLVDMMTILNYAHLRLEQHTILWEWVHTIKPHCKSLGYSIHASTLGILLHQEVSWKCRRVGLVYLHKIG